MYDTQMSRPEQKGNKNVCFVQFAQMYGHVFTYTCNYKCPTRPPPPLRHVSKDKRLNYHVNCNKTR